MKTVAAVLFAACLVHSCFASVAPVECLGSPSAKCSAVSILRILVTQGKCSGVARADCKTWSQSETVYQEAFSEWWSQGDKICDGNTVTAAAKAVASAIAKVWTSAAVEVECSEGQGFACGWSFANGETTAASIAEAVAQAAADASLALEDTGDDGAAAADAFCFADIRAIRGALASAAATAATDACAFSGEDPVSTYTASYASAIETVVADAFAKASAKTCFTEDGKGGSDVAASSLCSGTAEVDSKVELDGSGDFCFGTRDVPLCTGIVEEACCGNKTSRSRVCRVSRSTCQKCNGPWIRFRRGEAVLYEDSKGNTCLCDTVEA